MNRISILTFQGADNYGAILQNYALQAAIENLGFSAETLNYRCKKIDLAYKISIWPRKAKGLGGYIEKTIRNISNYRKMYVRKEAFQRFRNTHLKLTRDISKSELPSLNGKYDVFIVGSDQVWNVEITTEDEVDSYTLQFVTAGKRAAYAASVGSRSLVTPLLLDRLSTFDFISVRERSLKEKLDENGLKDVHEVCDPVFLLEGSQWKHLFQISNQNDIPYVFVYYVDSKDICLLSKALALERNLEIHHVNRTKKETLGLGVSHYGIGPAEFIAEIAHADAVVVSSFHGLAFAILFEKEFFVIHHSSRGDRTRDLLAALNLSDRAVASYEDYRVRKDSIKPIDWNAVKELLAKIREDSLKVLEDICTLS